VTRPCTGQSGVWFLVKVKLKFILEQAMKAQRGCRRIALLSLQPQRGWVVNDMPRLLYPWGRPSTHWVGGWLGPRASLDGCGKSRPHQVRSPDCSAHSKLLYRLSYPVLFWFLVGARYLYIVLNIETGSGIPVASTECVMGPLSQGVKVTTRFHLLQRLRMSGAIPLLYIDAFITCTGSSLHFNSMSVCDISKFRWCHKWLAIGRRLQSVYVMLEMNLVNE